MAEQSRRVRDIDPAVQLFVQDSLSDTRHALRSDIAGLGARVEAAAILSTKEHAEVKATLDQLLSAVEVLRQLEPRVTALEQKDVAESAAAAAVDKLRRQQRWFAMFVVAVIPVALVAAPHVH